MKNLVSVLFITFFIQSVFAAEFYLSVAGRGGLGQGGSVNDETVTARDIYVFGADTTLGIMLGNIMIGANAEYQIWKQKTEASQVNGTNLSGQQLSFSPAVAISFSNFVFQVKSQLMSTYTMDRKSSLGNKVEYKEPNMPAYSLMLAYGLGKSFVGLEYAKMEYKKLNINGEDLVVDSDQRLSLSSTAVVYGYKF